MSLFLDSTATAVGDDRPREKCGVVAVFGVEHAATVIYNALFALQHRGQEGAGMVVSDGMWAIAHNGNLVNAGELRDRYQKQGSIFQTTSDSEILLHQLSDPAFFGRRDRIRNALAELCGSFAFVIARPNCAYAARDPWGIRPLSLGRLGRGYVVTSETCAMRQIGAEFVRDINPGELVKLDDKGVTSMRFADVPSSGYGQCVFEHIYFARPDSHVFGQSVYQVRSMIGSCLAREHAVAADVVVPIPDSGVLAALGYARESGLPFEMGFIRNHYVGRTFIMPSQSSRSSGADLKLAVVPEAVAGKRVVLVDDSIIRGTTISKRIAALRQAGATEVHVRISCPPTRHPCFFGIDFPEPSALVAHGRSEDQYRLLCGADSVAYLSLDGLRSALRNPERYCMGCFTGRYVCETGHAVCKNGLEHNGGDDVETRHHRHDAVTR